MKKIILTFFAFSFFFSLFSQEKKDSTRLPFKVSGNVFLTNNGISPVPAFSLDKPAIMATLNVKRGNLWLSLENNYAYDGKPWSFNNWFRVQFPHNRFTFRTGINWSLFFKRTMFNDNGRIYEVQQVDKYLELETGFFYQISDKTTVQFIWWNANGINLGAIEGGNFYSLSASISKIPLSKSLFLGLRPHIFYTKNKGPFEGFFVASSASISHKNSPFSLSFQGVQPLYAKPSTDFSWNCGLNYSF